MFLMFQLEKQNVEIAQKSAEVEILQREVDNLTEQLSTEHKEHEVVVAQKTAELELLQQEVEKLTEQLNSGEQPSLQVNRKKTRNLVDNY